MSFQWPQMLAGAVVLPLLVLLYLWLSRRRQLALRMSSLAVTRAALADRLPWRRHLPPLLFLLGIALLLLAIARPTTMLTLPSLRETVILALDISGSMRARDVLPSRMEAAQTAARAFVESQPKNTRIGIVAFASMAEQVQAPTADRDALLAAIDRLRPRGRTAVGSAILSSLQALFPAEEFVVGATENPQGGAPLGQAGPAARPSAVPPGSLRSTAVILLTDGQTSDGPDPVEAARLAAEKGVRIFTVGFGSTDGTVLEYGGAPMLVRLDEDALKRIADVTRAAYFRAGGVDDLRKVYAELSTQLVLDRQRTDLSALFAAAAALLLTLAMAMSLWQRRLF